MSNIFYYKFPIGTVRIAEENGSICNISFGNESEFSNSVNEKTPLIEKAAAQLTEYFDGKRVEFDLPLALHGTNFQMSVWKALQTIPFGETRSYKEIATMVGNSKASRAIGLANHNNPIAIIVPCHRVVGQNGSLTGYAGGLPIKEYLLNLEMNQMV